MLRRIMVILAGLAILTIPAVSLAKSDPPRYMSERLSEDALKQWPAPAPEPAPVVSPEPAPEPEAAPEPAPVRKSTKKKPAIKKKTCSAAEMIAGAYTSNPCSKPQPAKKKSGCENGVVTFSNSGCNTCSQSVVMSSEGCQSKPKPKPTSCTSSMLGVATASSKCK